MQTQQEEDTAKEDNKFTKGDDVSIETVDNKVESRGNAKPQAEPEEPASPRPPAARKLDSLRLISNTELLSRILV